jgi:hypothetical protein
MDFLKQYQTAILFLAIVLALFGAYQFFVATPDVPALTVTETPGGGIDQDLVALLFELKSIRLDNALFEDPLFSSLQDFGQDLVAEPVGRNNPFAPLPGSTPTPPKPASPRAP